MRMYSNLTIPEVIILKSIKENGRIDFVKLGIELGLPAGMIVNLVQELYVRRFIKVKQKRIYLTDKVYHPLLECEKWFSDIESISDKVEFEWNYLYVPDNFDNIEKSN